MSTTLKIAVSLAVFLTYLSLQAETAPAADNSLEPQPSDGRSCTDLDDCERTSCSDRCKQEGFRQGYCKTADVDCKDLLIRAKKCACLGKPTHPVESHESTEVANAGKTPNQSGQGKSSDGANAGGKTPNQSGQGKSSDGANAGGKTPNQSGQGKPPANANVDEPVKPGNATVN